PPYRVRLRHSGCRVRRLAGVERLRLLAAVAIDGDRLQPLAPRLDVRLDDVADRRVRRQVHRLRDRAGDEGLRRAHDADVAEVVDRARASLRLEGTVEDGDVVVTQMRRAFDRLLLVDVLDDLLHLTG